MNKMMNREGLRTGLINNKLINREWLRTGLMNEKDDK